jgi:hypothetical protein
MNTTGNVRMNVTLRCVRVAIVALQKEKVLHMSASLFLVIYHVVRMRSIILSVASSALPHFPTLSYKRYDFREKKK